MQDEDYPPSRHRLPHADEAPWEYLGISKTEWVVQVVRYIDGFNADCDDDISDGYPPEPRDVGLIDAFEAELRHCVEGTEPPAVRPTPIPHFGG